MAAKSAEAKLRKAIIVALKATAYPGDVSGRKLPVSADVRAFPRIELTDMQESGAIDKGEDVRELGFVVEAISLSSYEEAALLNEAVETTLVGQDTVTMTGFASIDIYKELGTEIVEVGDADILIIRRRTQYRANVSKTT